MRRADSAWLFQVQRKKDFTKVAIALRWNLLLLYQQNEVKEM